ncbi:hypothetical protein MKW98_011409 [Papaver atlanticum]|uniref:Transmembrane protein n=1 Tax=Papaver atlanticum TaxID=357466 RepID=A0AAD4SHY3_9MAGN|nr:hypothetical protein MKW98_011409 [Papaver atlanticum]
MVIFSAVFHPLIPSIITKPPPPLLTTPLIPQPMSIRIPIRNPRNPKRFVVFAEGINGLNSNEKENGNKGKEEKNPFSNFNWKDLLDPNPENFAAIALTGLLTWASVQVLGQLLFISFAILVAALKYSFIAALLIFILITLL